jgi:hypothetical protein
MNLINTITLDYPRSLWQLRQENPNVSFPAEPTDEDLAPFDHANVHPTPPPEYDQRTQRIEESKEPMVDDDGSYHQVWIVRDATEQEIADWDAAHIQPDWRAFKQTALASGSLKAILLEAQLAAPQAASALTPALFRAEQGIHEDFADCWAAIVAAVEVPGEVVSAFHAKAEDCHLPAAFVAVFETAE